mgnify:CR=1 FL=1
MAVVLFIVSANAWALEVGLSVSQTSEYTTNGQLTETDEVEEWVHRPGVRLSAAHDGPQLSMGVEYSFNKIFYRKMSINNF